MKNLDILNAIQNEEKTIKEVIFSIDNETPEVECISVEGEGFTMMVWFDNGYKILIDVILSDNNKSEYHCSTVKDQGEEKNQKIIKTAKGLKSYLNRFYIRG